MALTPMDIYNKEFSKGFRGYDEEEVDMFLDQVVDEYEKLQKANAAADDKIQTLTERLEHFKSLEETLKETLMTAQNTAEEVVENARKKGALIIDSAKREARDIVERAGDQIQQVEKMDLELRKAATVFKSRFVALLEAQLEFFRQETADINAQRDRVRNGAASPAPDQAEDRAAPQEPGGPVQEPVVSATDTAAPAPKQERSEADIPPPESEQPVTPMQPEDSAVSFLDQEEPMDPVQPPESPSEIRQPEPVSDQEQPVSGIQPDAFSSPGMSGPQPEPLDTTDDEIDDADALIREIQHYSALRNDEDTVSDEGFIIGGDDK